MKTIVACTLLLIATLTLGISRVGGGVCSVKSKFTGSVSPRFREFDRFGPDLILLKAEPTVTANGITEQSMLFKEFALQFPDWVDLSAEEVNERLVNLGFAARTERDLGCAKVWSKYSPQGLQMVGTWGGGLGFYLVGNATYDVKKAFEEFYRTLEIEGDACRWEGLP